jgi:hypothetical protein
MTGCACDLPVLTANIQRGRRQTQQTNTRLEREMKTTDTSFALFHPTDRVTDPHFSIFMYQRPLREVTVLLETNYYTTHV